MKVSLPKVSVAWTGAIIMACLVVGAFALYVFSSSHESDAKTTIALASIEASITQDTQTKEAEGVLDHQAAPLIAEHDSKKDQIEPLGVHVEAQSAPQENTSSKIDASLEETHIEAHDPVELPKKEGENGIKDVVQVSVSDNIETPKEPVTPYYDGACIEKKENGHLLPIKSKKGLRPFDVYQGEYLPNSSKTYLTIVVSELGTSKALFDQVKDKLPKEVTCAFLTATPLSKELNKQARERGHETILMLPMEPMDYPNSDPGAHVLLTNLKASENKVRLENSLAHFTGYVAVMPYMGNRFARVKRDFKPILKDIRDRGLGYFESRYTRSKTIEWKPGKLPYAKASYDLVRGTSLKKIQKVLEQAKTDLLEKRPVILTVQADKVALDEVQKWLPTALTDNVILVPISAVSHS